MSLQLNKTKLIGKWTIAAAAIQGATTGHAYWIDATGALVDAGASIAAANPTNQPPINFDVSQYSDLQWSLFYGAQTSNVGGKIGIAELWPTYPVDVVNTIPPFVRDVASHWLVTAGLGFTIQQRVPADVSVIYDVTSTTAQAMDTGILNTGDFAALWMTAVATAGTTALTPQDVFDDGGTYTISGPTAAANNALAWGLGANIAAPAGYPNYIASPLQSRVKIGTSAAAAGIVRLRVLGERKRPLRRPSRIAPYIQWVNPGTGGAAPVVPTAGSQPIYLQLWGRIADGEVR